MSFYANFGERRGLEMAVIVERNTRFALPIIHPKTGEEVSAETLYNRCCEALGHTVRDHIADLIFDNFAYSAADVCGTDAENEKLHDAVYAWAAAVRAEIAG
jgi:hypothetical protein